MPRRSSCRSGMPTCCGEPCIAASKCSSGRSSFLSRLSRSFRGFLFRGRRAAPASVKKPLVGLLQIHDESLLVGLGIMDQAAQVAEAALAEPGIDHVDRRALLADEEHPLAASHVIGNQVGDRLRFAGAGRSLDDVAGAGPGFLDRRRLRGVGRHDVIAFFQRHGGRQLAFGRPGRQGKRGVKRRVCRRVVQQRLVVPHERHLAVLEVPQRHAAQVEVPNVGILSPPSCK